MLTFEICRDPEDAVEKKCFDYETVIEPWIRRKYMFTLENRTLFQKDVVDRKEKFLRYSELKWNVLSPQIRQDVYHKLEVTRLHLEDSYSSFGFD